MKKAMGIAAMIAVAGCLSVVSADTYTTDFESGADGWSGPTGIGGTSGIQSSGGNSGAYLGTEFNDFGVTFRNTTNSAFVQDLTQFSSVTISIDVKVDYLNFFGQDVSRPWLVELRDYDNDSPYPWDSVWFKFTDISQAANSEWTTLSVTIDDTTASGLPAGWGGYGDEDPNTFEPILPSTRTFSDILASYDEMVFTTLQPGFFFSFTDHTIGLDNISITTVPTPAGLALLAMGGIAGTRRKRA